jgi:hypothetical protein
VKLFSLSILTDKIVLVVQSCTVPVLSHFLGWLSPSAESQMVGRTLNPNCHVKAITIGG